MKTNLLLVAPLGLALTLVGCGENHDTPDGGPVYPDCDPGYYCDITTHECEPAYGNSYRFTVVSVKVSKYNQNAESWDDAGGNPDPFVCFHKNDLAEAEFCTSVNYDTLSATYNESFDTAVNESDKWEIRILDLDVSENDVIDIFITNRISLSWVKKRGFVKTGEYATELMVDIGPIM